MRLSFLCFGKAPVWAKVKRIPGLLYAGKYQLYKPVTNGMKKRAVESLLREERNLELLSRPYLTKAQEVTAKAMQGKKEAKLEQVEVNKQKARLLVAGNRNLKMDDFFEFHNRTKAWE